MKINFKVVTLVVFVAVMAIASPSFASEKPVPEPVPTVLPPVVQTMNASETGTYLGTASLTDMEDNSLKLEFSLKSYNSIEIYKADDKGNLKSATPIEIFLSPLPNELYEFKDLNAFYLDEDLDNVSVITHDINGTAFSIHLTENSSTVVVAQNISCVTCMKLYVPIMQL